MSYWHRPTYPCRLPPGPQLLRTHSIPTATSPIPTPYRPEFRISFLCCGPNNLLHPSLRDAPPHTLPKGSPSPGGEGRGEGEPFSNCPLPRFHAHRTTRRYRHHRHP